MVDDDDEDTLVTRLVTFALVVLMGMTVGVLYETARQMADAF
jgi:hypothetical protein